MKGAVKCQPDPVLLQTHLIIVLVVEAFDLLHNTNQLNSKKKKKRKRCFCNVAPALLEFEWLIQASCVGQNNIHE